MSYAQITGRYRYRADKEGHVILQLEEKYLSTSCLAGHIDSEWVRQWRDAMVEDVTINMALYPVLRADESMPDVDWGKEVEKMRKEQSLL